MSDTVNGAELLARLKPKLREETAKLCMSNDLLDEWADLHERLATSRANDMAGNRLADGESTKTKALAKQVVDIEDRIDADAVEVRLRAVSKDRWRALCDAHPPRKGDQLDAYQGYNRDAVLDAAVRMCMVSPVFEDCTVDECSHEECGTWEQFISVCNPNEWQELVNTVNSVNRGVVDAPKSELASRILGRRATT